MKQNLSRYILAIILIFSFFLILLHLDTRSLWLDEGVTFYNSGAQSLEAVADRVASLDLSPPGYYYLMYFWQKIIGTTDLINTNPYVPVGIDRMETFSFRFLSVLFAVLSVWLVYAISRQAFSMSGQMSGKKIGLIAAFLLAINPFFIGFAQEARMYMLLTFLILLAFYALLKILYEEDNAKWWVTFTAANIFGLYTHNFYFFAGFALAMCMLLFLGTIRKRGQTVMAAMVSLLITILMYLPWLPNFLKQLEVDRYWIAEINWHEVKSYLLDFAAGEKLSFYVLAGFAMLGLVYVFSFLKKKEFRRSLYALLLLGVFGLVAFAVPIWYSFVEAPLAKVRYFLFVPALLSIAAAIGIYSLKKIHWLLSFVPIITLFIIWQPWQVSAYPVEMNEDFRAVSWHIENSDEVWPPVIVHTPSSAHVFDFYYRGKDVRPFPDTFDLRNYNISEENSEEFAELVKDMTDFWLLITHSHENPQGVLREWAEQRCPQIEEHNYNNTVFFARYTCS